MSIPPAIALTLLALAPVMAAPQESIDGVALAQLVIHQRIIIRIPVIPDPPPAPPATAAPEQQRWVEKKGPKCVPMNLISGADVSGADQVDLIQTDGKRMRARLDDDCPSLDFYTGFYLRQTSDGMVCAGRDSFRSRSGGACQISEFRALRARRWLDNLPLIRKR